MDALTAGVGLVSPKPPLQVRGRTLLPVLTLCVCCCPSLTQRGGKLNQRKEENRSDWIKPTEPKNTGMEEGRAAISCLHQPASVTGETSVMPCARSGPWGGFAWNASSALMTGLELWQEHPPAHLFLVLLERSGANRDLLFPCWEEQLVPSSGKSQKESDSGHASPDLGFCPGPDAGLGLLDACSGLETSNHTVSFLQDKTLWWPWWEGYTVPREVGTPTEDVPRQPQTLSTIHQPFCVASCGVFTPNILPLCFSSAEAPKMSLWDYLGLALAVQPHSSMAPGAAGSPESRLAPPLWGDAPRERCPSHRTTQGSSSPSCASGCRTAVGRGLRVPSSSSAARPSRSWVSTSSSTSLWMRAKCSQGAVGLWIRRSAPCTWPRRCKKLRFLGWALGTSLLWGTMERSVGEGGRGRGIRGRCLMLGASGWQTWRKTARLGSAGECAWKTRSFLWTASWWSAWMSLVQGKTVRAACSRWFSWCVCRLWWVLIYAQVRRFWPLLFSPW